MIKKLKILVVLMSVSLTLGLMSNTYSRYVADTTGSLGMDFAKWQIKVNESDITDGTTTTLNITPTMDDNKNVASDKIAPSSSGYFDIVVDASNVDVSFDYSINFDFTNNDIPDLMVNTYSILDDTYVEGDDVVVNTLTDNVITGTMNYDNKTNDFNFKPFTIRVYFKWYEGAGEAMDDIADTEVSKNIENTEIQIESTIHFEQKLNA